MGGEAMRAVGIDAIVVALCADFARRQSVIAARTAEQIGQSFLQR